MNDKVLAEIKVLNTKVDLIIELLKRSNNGASLSNYGDTIRSQIQEKIAQSRREIEMKTTLPQFGNTV